MLLILYIVQAIALSASGSTNSWYKYNVEKVLIRTLQMDRIYHLGLHLGRRTTAEESSAMLCLSENDLKPFSEILFQALVSKGISQENLEKIDSLTDLAREDNLTRFMGGDEDVDRFDNLFNQIFEMIPLEERKGLNLKRLSADPFSAWKIHQYLAQGVYNEILVLIEKSRGNFILDNVKYWNRAFLVTAPLAEVTFALLEENKDWVANWVKGFLIDLVKENCLMLRNVGTISAFSFFIEEYAELDSTRRKMLSDLREKMGMFLL